MKKTVFTLLLCMLSLSAFCQSSVTLGGTLIEWQVSEVAIVSSCNQEDDYDGFVLIY